MNLMAYFKNKDTSLVVPTSLFRYEKIKSNKPLINQVNNWRYAESAYMSLSLIDDRYSHVSPTFRDEVVKRALCAEFCVINLGNKTKGEIYYPDYLSVLRGINYFSMILKIQASNAFEHSIIQEIKFYKEEYTKANGPDLTREDLETLKELYKIKAS